MVNISLHANPNRYILAKLQSIAPQSAKQNGMTSSQNENSEKCILQGFEFGFLVLLQHFLGMDFCRAQIQLR